MKIKANHLVVLVLLTLVLLSATFFGAATALGSLKLDVVLLGMIAGVAILFMPVNWLLWIVAVLVFLVIGQLEYFAKIVQALWIPYMMVLALYLRIPYEYFKYQKKSGMDSKVPPVFIFVSLFVLAVIFFGVLNFTPLLQFIVGAKNYIGFWSLLALAYIARDKIKKDLNNLWRAVLLVPVIQLPFVLYQYFFIVPKRAMAGSVVAWDSVVGSFGGNPMAGGASGTLAYMMMLVLTLAVLQWRQSLTSFWYVAFIFLVSLVLVLLAEIKIVLVLLPFIFVMIYRKEFYRNPLAFIFSGIFVVAVLAIILQGYQYLHYQGRGASEGVLDLYIQSFSYSLDPSLIKEGRELGRTSAFVFWWDKNGFSDLWHTLFGYGAGASRGTSSFAVGEVARQYSFNIDRSTAVQLLWDVGLLGLISYMSIIFYGLYKAFSLLKENTLQLSEKIALETSAIGLMMMLIMLPYGRDVLEVPAMQFMLILMLATIIVLSTKNAENDATIQKI